MKKFNENMNSNVGENEEALDYVGNEDIINENLSGSNEDNKLKKLEDNEEKDEYITPAMKNFRKLIGVVCLALFIISMFTMGSTKTALKDNLSSGIIENVNAGEILSKDSVKLESKDETVKVSDGYGNLEIQVWNFEQKEDYDYVQVFIDGTEAGEPFAIRHRPVKISVPDKAVITVQGVRDGSNNGITYGVSFNKTGETYLNKVNANGTNTYTIISD